MEAQGLDFKKFLPIIAIIAGVIIIIIVFILVISNSGGSNNNTDKVELEMWGLWETKSVMDPLIKEYQKTNQNVIISYSERPSTNYKTTLSTRLEETQGPGPDIAIIHNTWVPTFKDKLTPLPEDVMSRDEYSTTFYPTALDDFTASDRRLYGIPLMFDGLGMFYNKELLAKAGIAEPPDDWNEFKDAALKMTEKDARGDIKVAGAAIGTSNNINHYFDLISVLMLQNNVKMMASDGLTANFSSDEDGSRGAATMDFYTSFAEADSDSYVWSDALGNDLEAFARGEVAIMFAPSWRVFDVLNLNASRDFDVAPLPQLPSSETTESPTINWATYWGYGVSKNADNPEEAWRFIKFLASKDIQNQFFNEGSNVRPFGEIYSRRDLASELKGQKYVDAYVTMAPTARDWPMRDDDKAKELFGIAISSKLGGQDSKSVLEDIAIQLTNHLGGDPTLIR
jgi:multiple sugar transport system substrate-binding protein